MPIDLAIKYLQENEKRLRNKFFEVYIGLVVGQAEQVIIKRENIVYMDFDNFWFYLMDFKANSMNSWMGERSVVMFFVYDKNGVPMCR